MKVELSVRVYFGNDLFDTFSLCVPVEPWARALAKVPEDCDDVSFEIERLEVSY